MSKIKFNQKIVCSFLFLTMLGMSMFQATRFLSLDLVMMAKSNNISIETIDDSTAKIHYDNIAFKNNDILLSKERQGGNFNYVVSDSETKNKLCSFTSSYDLNINDTSTVRNRNMCVAAWAILDAVKGGGDPMKAVLALGPAFSALGEGTLTTIISLILSEGPFAIPAIIGLLSVNEAFIAIAGVSAIA